MGYQKAVIFLFLTLLSLPAIYARDLPSPDTIFPKVQAVLKDQQTDFFQHTVRRMGNKKITLEAFVSMEAEWSLIKLISKQILEYPKWTFPHINERGDGDKFYIQFTSITNDPNNPNNIDIEITLALPGLKIPIHRSFQFEPVFPKDPNVFAVKATVLESKDSPVQDMFGYVYFFKNPKNPSRVWAYSDISVVLTHWLVYESLPERLLQRETGDRIRILMENYQSFENSKRESDRIKSP
jgi:hypothetical protein